MRSRVAVIAVIVTVVALIGVLVLGRGGDADAGPTADLATRGPVLLVPGYGGGDAGFTALIRALSDQSVPTEVIDIGDGTGDLTAYADQVSRRIDQLTAAGAPSVDLVGFSAGGLIARDAATNSSSSPFVRKVVTIGSPHAGTQVAALGRLVGECPTACEQLTPDSDYLKSLPKADGTDRWVSIWSTSDEVVRPTTSSELAGALWFPLQDVCPREVAHNDLIRDPLVITVTTAFLAGAALPTGCST